MKKNWKIAAVVTIAVALFAGAGTFVMAQTTPTDEAVCPGGGQGFGLRGFGGNSGVITDILGLTADELYQLRSEGKTLAEIAASKGITEDALVAALLAPRQEALQAAVAEGRLTQEQANLMLQNMEENVRLQITSNAGPRGFGGCGGVIGEGFGPRAGGAGCIVDGDELPATGTQSQFGRMGMRR